MTNEPTERILPADLTAERAVLGSCLLEPEAINQIAGILPSDAFSLQKHIFIYQAILSLYERRIPPDLTTVADELRRHDTYNPAGGLAYLGELSAEVPTALHVEYYASIVKRTYILRRIIRAGAHISAAGYNERQELDATFRSIEEQIESIDRMANRIAVVPANELYAMQLDPVRVIIPQLLVQGFGFLAAHPGMGKTWLLLQWAIAKASGGHVFGEIQVPQSKVLFLALEDTQESLQERLRKLCPDRAPPADMLIITKEVGWKAIDEGGISDLEAILRQHTDLDLIIIDTLTAVSPRIPRGNPYREEYKAFKPLADLADRYRVAIVGAYHFNQGGKRDVLEMVNGSAGLPSVAVNRIGIVRERGQGQGQLVSVAKRGTGDVDWTLQFDTDTCQWVKLGDTATVKMGETRQIILEHLEQTGTATLKELLEMTGASYNTLVQNLKRMRDDGVISSPKKGIYELTLCYDTSHMTEKSAVMTGNAVLKPQTIVHDSHDTHDTRHDTPECCHDCHDCHDGTPKAPECGENQNHGHDTRHDSTDHCHDVMFTEEEIERIHWYSHYDD